MPENILQKVVKRFRVGSGGPPKAVSIVDTATGRAPDYSTPRISVSDEDFDDAKSGMPIMLAHGHDIATDWIPYPSGLLPGVDPDDKDRKIPRYEADDPVVLNRLFGLHIAPDE